VARAPRRTVSRFDRGAGRQLPATRLVAGELRSQRFNDRDAAARWLAKLDVDG